MKKSTFLRLQLITIILGFSGFMHGQIVKGTMRLGPDLSFSSSKTEIDGLDFEIKTSQVNLGLGFGYYIIDNLEIGLGLNYTSTKSEVDNFEETANGIFFGPQVEYKIGLSSQFFIPIYGGLGYNSVKSEDDSGDEISYNGVSYGLGGGIEYIVNNKMGARLLLGPNFGTLKDSDSDSEFDLTVISASIGVNFYF